MGKQFVKPPKATGVPEPRVTRARRLSLPDGEQWVDVLGGYSHAERDWLAGWWRRVREIDPALLLSEDERAEADLKINVELATFLDSHIVGHNLYHYGTEERLPDAGFDLFWEIPGSDSIALATRICNPPSFFADPKVEPPSASG